MRNLVKIFTVWAALLGASAQAMEGRAMLDENVQADSVMLDKAVQTDSVMPIVDFGKPAARAIVLPERDWHADVSPTKIMHIDEIPGFCIGLLRRLERQPWLAGAGCEPSAKVKFLPLADWDESCICDIMAQNAADVLGRERKWRVDSGDFIRRSGRWLGGGLRRIYYVEDTPCSIEELQAVYMQILQKIKSGWVQTTLREHPDIYYKESEKDWVLFYKKEARLQEDNFIDHFARKLCMSFYVKCSSEWTDTRFVAGRVRDDVYLWVRKEAPAEFQKIFGFEITR